MLRGQLRHRETSDMPVSVEHKHTIQWHNYFMILSFLTCSLINVNSVLAVVHCFQAVNQPSYNAMPKQKKLTSIVYLG